MTVPSAFVAAWQRQSIALDGGEPSEPATVVWVQATSAFADLRVPRDGTGPVLCFAGHTRWDPPHLRWRHDIDLSVDGPGRDDVGAVTWVDDDLVETGVTLVGGATVPYVEVWRKLPGSAGAVVEHTDAISARVQVGTHELVAEDRRAAGGGFSASYRRDGAVVLQIGGSA